MNNNTTSQYMDKQIMDLSNSQSAAAASNNSGGNNEFIDFMNRPPEKKDDIVPSYEFMPIRPAIGSSSPKAPRSPSNFDSGDEDAPIRTWNSLDSRPGASPIRNYNSLDADEPAKFVLGNNPKHSNVSLDASLVSEIDKTMKKYMDNLTHAVDKMSARLSQLETRTRNLEHSIDDLKVSVGNNHGITDGKMRLLENILNEVQAGVQLIRDKQEIVEAQVQISKMHISKVEQVESTNTSHPDPTQTGVRPHQHFSTISPAQPPPPNAPPPPSPQHNLQPQIQPPNQFPQNQLPSIPHRESYFPSPVQTPENLSQQYQPPPPPPPLQLQQQQQQQQHPGAPPLQLQYQPPSPPPQYSQPPPPSQPHPSFPPVNPSLPQQPIGHQPEESMYAPPQTYPSGIRPPPPSQQYYSPTTNVYEPPSSKPALGYSSSFGPSPGNADPYPYNSSPSQYGNSSPLKPQHMSQSGGSGYPQLPTARILPQALPAAAAVGGGGGGGGSASASGGSGNRVPIDDVVDRVTNMGFPRDQVRATVRKLTENGQAVDLNIVLDKLMNDGEGRNWLGR